MAADDRVVHIGLRIGLGEEEATLRAPVPLEIRVEAAALLRWNEEPGSAERGLDLTGKRVGVERVVGAVLRAHVAAERHMATDERAEPEAAVNKVLRKVVWGSLPEHHVGVAARGEQGQPVAHREVEHEGAADRRDGDVRRPGQVRRRDVIARDFEGDLVAPVVCDARAAAEPVLYQKRAVEPPPGTEAAELDILRALRQGGMRHQGYESHQENQPLHRDSSHDPRPS